MMKRLYEVGCKICGRAADISGHPLAILLVAVFCAIWFIVGGPKEENLLTLILSVTAITLTQMVLNGQRRSERAMHLKMDELVLALEGARNELAGIEVRSIDELEQLANQRPASVDQRAAACFSSDISSARSNAPSGISASDTYG